MIVRYTSLGDPKGRREDMKADRAASDSAKPIAISSPSTSPAYPIVSWPVIEPMNTVAVVRLLTQGAVWMKGD